MDDLPYNKTLAVSRNGMLHRKQFQIMIKWSKKRKKSISKVIMMEMLSKDPQTRQKNYGWSHTSRLYFYESFHNSCFENGKNHRGLRSIVDFPASHVIKKHILQQTIFLIKLCYFAFANCWTQENKSSTL